MSREASMSLLFAFPVLIALNCGGNTEDTRDAGSGGSAGSSASGGSSGVTGSGGTTGGSSGSAGSGAATGGVGGTGGSAGTNQWGACSLTSECVVRPASCCGSCGAATRRDAIAIHRANADGYTLAMCQDTGCPACDAPQDPTLIGHCENGACQVVDLLAQPLTECSADVDCRVRTASCCECGGNTALEALIAIRADSEAEYRQLACDPGTDCGKCAVIYPEGAVAVCMDGRCTVTGAPGTTPKSR
jgi:hypothetical protein